MKHFLSHSRIWITITVVFVLLAAGLVISCGRGGSQPQAQAPLEDQSGTGTVIITGRIL